MALLLQACFRHAERAASGICAHCRRNFCKECLTPYGGRLACADCLVQEAGPSQPTKRKPVWLAWGAAVASACLLWALCTAGALFLSRLPTASFPWSAEEAP